MQDKTEQSSCSACGHHLQDLTHLLLDCPASEPLWRAIIGTTSSIRSPVQTLGRGQTVGFPRSSSEPTIPRNRSGSTTTTRGSYLLLSKILFSPKIVIGTYFVIFGTFLLGMCRITRYPGKTENRISVFRRIPAGN